MKHERQETLELLVIGAMLASKTVRPDVRLFDVVPHRIVNELLARESKHNTAAWLKVPADGSLVENMIAELSRRRLDRIRERVDMIARFTGGGSVVALCREVLEYETTNGGMAAGENEKPERAAIPKGHQEAEVGRAPAHGVVVPAAKETGVANPPVPNRAKTA